MSSLDDYLPPERMLVQLPGAFVWKDINLRYRAMNANLVQNFGFNSIEETIGLSSYDIRCPAVEYAEDFLRNDRDTLETGHNIHTVDFHVFADGKAKLFLGERAPIRDECNTMLGLLYHAKECEQDFMLKVAVKLWGANARLHGPKTLSKGARFLLRTESHGLSSGELEVLFYCMRGKTAKQIADILHLSVRTVETHFDHIKQKMNCRNKSDLIEKAINQGLFGVVPKSIFFSPMSVAYI